MMKQFEQLTQREYNGSMKWEKEYIEKRFKINTDKDIYPLFIADMDFQMDKEIQKQMKERISDPDFGYFHIQNGYFESIIAWQKKQHHLDLKREWILPSIGTVTSMNIACDIFARDEGILMMTPVYGSFQKCAGVGTMHTLPLLEENGRYKIDFLGLQTLLEKESIKVLMFCNPHNPSGRVWTKQELQTLVTICKKYQVLILSDEIHSDLSVSNQQFVSLFNFSNEYDQIMICTSPNKTFNISGLTTSYILSKNTDLLEKFQAYLDRLHLSCNRMGIMMSEIVYTYGYDWHKKLLVKLSENVNMVCEQLSLASMNVMIPDCGYLVWIQLPKVKDVDAFVLALAKETHVLIEPGSRFIDHYAGWVRINAATSSSLLSEALKRFISFYHMYQEK